MVWAFVLSYSMPYILQPQGANLGARTAFIFFGVNAFGFLGTFFYVPELSGRSLEEVDELFIRDLWAWQFSKAETHGVGARIANIEAGVDVEKAAEAHAGNDAGAEGQAAGAEEAKGNVAHIS